MFINNQTKVNKMKKWIWDLSFRTGFEKIDLQHKQLFSIANELLSSEDSKDIVAKVKSTLQKLKEYVETHFKDEEALMFKYNYPFSEDHQKIHNGIIAEIRVTIKKSLSPIELKNNLDTLLSSWIRNHILLEDLHFSEWAKAQKIIN